MDAIREKLLPYGDVEAKLEQLRVYAALLRRRAAEFSLIAPSTVETLEERHFLDSLHCLDALNVALAQQRVSVSRETKTLEICSCTANAGTLVQQRKLVSRETDTLDGQRGLRLIDVGSGAGFPGLVLAVAAPEISITLLDSNAKRCGFLHEAAAAMGLENVDVLTGRAEDFASTAIHRERYDAAVSRAVADAAQLVELCAAFVRIGGVMLAMKSQVAAPELANAANALKTLGFSPFATYDYSLGDAALCIAAAEKRTATPTSYPRTWARIKARPL